SLDECDSVAAAAGIREGTIYARRHRRMVAASGWQGADVLNSEMKKELIELKVNGRLHELAVEPSALLLDVLRQALDLTGSKRGCDESSCGACTVLVDGVAMMSCTLLAASCQEQEITTIEGVSEHGS